MTLFVCSRTAMLVCYALEDRSRWFIFAFAAACALGSIYGFLQGAWPFGLVEAIWAGRAAALEPQAARECIARRCHGVIMFFRPRQRCPRRSPLSPERADHVAGPPTSRPFQDRISHRAGADGGGHGCGSGDRGGAGRGAGLAAMRDAVGGEGARADQHHPPARVGAGQHELLLPQGGRCRPEARGRMEAAAGALL